MSYKEAGQLRYLKSQSSAMSFKLLTFKYPSVLISKFCVNKTLFYRFHLVFRQNRVVVETGLQSSGWGVFLVL